MEVVGMLACDRPRLQGAKRAEQAEQAIASLAIVQVHSRCLGAGALGQLDQAGIRRSHPLAARRRRNSAWPQDARDDA